MSFACGLGVCPCDFCIQKMPGTKTYKCMGHRPTGRWPGDWDFDPGHEVRFDDLRLLRAHVLQHILKGDKIIKNPFGVLSEHQED